jgi:hypothetical protein
MRKLFRIFSFTFICTLSSCGAGNSAKIPKGIVPPDTMVSVIADIHLLQSSVILGYSRNNTDTNITQAYKSLWLKHHLTEESYNENVKYYCEHPKILDSVYEKVLTNLNQQKVELMGSKQLPAKKL